MARDGCTAGPWLRKIADHAGVDRKTVRRYVEAAQAAGLEKTDSIAAVNDDLIAAVVDTVRPDRPHGHGAAWEQLVPHQEQISKWVAGDGEQPLTIAKIEVLLARKGCVVPYRTLHRFATERCGFGRKDLTVRVVDGDPGIECQIDFGYLGIGQALSSMIRARTGLSGRTVPACGASPQAPRVDGQLETG